MNLIQALVWNVGNLCFDVKGAIQVEEPRGFEYRCKTTGADQPVVAVKLMKISGAKGLNYLTYSNSQLRKWKELN